MRSIITITTAICALSSLVSAQQGQQGPLVSQASQVSQSPQASQGPQGQQQQGNNTIFQLLNNTDGSSPSYQILQYLQSSPEYQSIIDILNDPNNNVTLFVPSDQVYYNITGQQQPNGTTTKNGTNPSATPSGQQSPTGAPGLIPSGVRTSFGLSDLLSLISPPTATGPSPAGPTPQAKYVKLPLFEQQENEGAERFVMNEPNTENLVMRALKGDELVRRQMIPGQGNPGDGTNPDQNNPGDGTTTSPGDGTTTNPGENNPGGGTTTAPGNNPNGGNNTVGTNPGENNTTTENNNASNYTTSPYYTEFNMTDLAWYHIVKGSIPLNETAIVLNTLLTNSTVNRFGSGSPLVVYPGNNSALMVGTGLETDATINQTIQAGNGMIYIINKVLVPPVNTTQTLDLVQNATSFTQLLSQYNSTANALNDATNYTLFVPINSALQNVDTSQLDNKTIATIFQAHVFSGVYYTTNLTSSDPVNITSAAGTNVGLQQDNSTGAITINGTNVVQSNILMDNGVIHLIDGILPYQTAQQSPDNSTEQQNPSESPMANPTNSATDAGPFPAASNVPSASVVTSVSNLISTGVMLSTTFILYFIYA